MVFDSHHLKLIKQFNLGFFLQAELLDDLLLLLDMDNDNIIFMDLKKNSHTKMRYPKSMRSMFFLNKHTLLVGCDRGKILVINIKNRNVEQELQIGSAKSIYKIERTLNKNEFSLNTFDGVTFAKILQVRQSYYEIETVSEITFA